MEVRERVLTVVVGTGRPGVIPAPVEQPGPLDTPCLIWRGSISTQGYGRKMLPGRVLVYVHRWAYELAHGPIPAGLEIDHLCRVRACFAVDHLEAVTPQENQRRGDTLAAAQVRRTHCPANHPYAGDNLAVKRDGSRRCRQCHRERARRRNAA